MHEFPARLPGLRYLHHGLERKAPFRGAGDLSCRPLCGVCDLSLFLRGVFGAVPSLRARRVHPQVFPTIPAVWRHAVPGKPPVCGRSLKTISPGPLQFRSAQGYRAAKQNQGCGPVSPDHRLHHGECGQYVLRDLSGKIPQERTAHRGPGNDSQLY